jgi:hypothetical protein
MRMSLLPQMCRSLSVAALAMVLSELAWCAPPRLGLPIRCEPGRDCFIQNYFDHDPGAGWRDYACGRLSYDGHHGTDFRLLDLPQMEAGVPVVAAADGRVVAVRDGEPDEPASRRGKQAIDGRDAGNGVRVNHGESWETQYSHMRKGSVRVVPGQAVRAGDILGLVGLSGNTEFPHVDLEVRKDGKAVDPFMPEAGGECGSIDNTLWSKDALAALTYIPTGLLIAGFSTTVPTREKAEAGGYSPPVLSESAEAIVFWAELFGLRAGDRLVTELRGPSNEILVQSESHAPSDKAIWFIIAGKNRTTGNWPKGSYRARILIERAGVSVINATKEAIVR